MSRSTEKQMGVSHQLTALDAHPGNDGPRPLVTLAVITYNQEQYIREAVDGALAQTYSPLQIIISDDCSPDATFDIAEDIVNKYEGPHDVLLNRNDPNLGIGKHVNKVMGLVKGDLVVLGAGDYISIP